MDKFAFRFRILPLKYQYEDVNDENPSYFFNNNDNDPPPIVDIVDDDNEGLDDENRDWRWCLLTLDGNVTIVQMRQFDFIRYLRMNVASLTGTDFDSVLFNTISYTPNLLVNISLDFQVSGNFNVVLTRS